MELRNEQRVRICENWWNPEDPGAFFPEVYRIGDDSIEGHLLNRHMTLEQRTSRDCDLIESALKPANGSRFLDCACGDGRHSLELAMRGHRVDGIDIDGGAITRCPNRASEVGLSGLVSFTRADMRDIPFKTGSFDFIISMFLSFGFFQHDDENLLVLREFSRLLKRGGRLLIHTDVNPILIREGKYGDRYERTLTRGGKLVIEEWYDCSSKRLEGYWAVRADNDRRLRSSYSVRIYSDEDMANMLNSVGFKVIHTVYADENGLTDSPVAQEVLYLAEKRSKHA